MKEWKRGFAGGVAATVLCSSLVCGSLAAHYQKQATLDYTGIKINVNGQIITPKDASGNTVDPFAISGTTYLPVRAVANALGLEVGWDQTTQTVILTEHPDGTSTASGTGVLDKSGIKVTYLGIRKRELPLEGYEIRLKIENSTGKDYTVQARDVSMNGCMVDSIISEDVAAGKSAITSITVYNAEERGVTAPITTAEFKLHIFDSDTWDTYFDTDAITVK